MTKDNKKEQQRAELHRAIWKIADDMRGSVDGWDFKQYVLGTLFYRYISENLTSYVNRQEHAAGRTEFDYARLDDVEAEKIRQHLIQTKGFFLLPSELFGNVAKRASQDKDLNITLSLRFIFLSINSLNSFLQLILILDSFYQYSHFGASLDGVINKQIASVKEHIFYFLSDICIVAVLD